MEVQFHDIFGSIEITIPAARVGTFLWAFSLHLWNVKVKLIYYVHDTKKETYEVNPMEDAHQIKNKIRKKTTLLTLEACFVTAHS